MRIGISTTTIDPCLAKQQFDGIGVYTQNLIECLQAQSIDTAGYSCPSFKYWLKIYNKQSSPYQSLMPYAITASFSAIFNMPHLQHRKIESDVSLYHATDYRLFKLGKIPTVATLHDAIFLKDKTRSSLKLREYINWVLKKMAKEVDSIITVSKAVVPDLIEYWRVSPDRINVIYNGISDQWFETIAENDKKQFLDKYKLPSNYLLFVGTLQPRKNLLRLIEAFVSLPLALQREYPLIIAGKAGWDCSEIIEKIKKLEQSGVVYWLNYVPFEYIRALYQCARIVVYPSLSEGFGLPVLEAFASRVPLIASNIPALAEVAGDAALLVNPVDTEAIRESILQLLQDSRLAKELKVKGYERAKTMTWKQCAAATLEVYKKLI